MTAHALRRLRPAHSIHIAWERWIAASFAIGSLCFFVGPFPGFAALVGDSADAAVFFIGSIFFTFAAGLELGHSSRRQDGHWVRDAAWWSAAIQFAGTLLFNLSTFNAMQDDLSAEQATRLVWSPDLFGSIAFLLSGLIAYHATAGWKFRPEQRDREWRIAAVNLAGCVFFMISAIASYIVPSTGSVLDLAAANFTTSAGGLCFLIGAMMLYPRRNSGEPSAAGA